MAAPILFGFNFLEQASTTVTVTGEAAGKPKTRLYDREIVEPYQDTSAAGTRFITGDKGAGLTESLDSYAVAAGHNLAAATVTFESGDNSLVYTTRDTFVVPGGTAAFRRSITQLAARAWRIGITGAAAAPIITELLFSRRVTLPRGPDEPRLRHSLVGNVVRHEASSGKVRHAVRGAVRWRAEYPFEAITPADRTNLETLFRDLDGGAKHFMIEDADGVLRWVEWLNPEVVFDAVPGVAHDVMLSLQEAVS